MIDRTSRATAVAKDLAVDADELLGLKDWRTLAALNPEERRTIVMGDIIEGNGVQEDLLPEQSYRLLGVSLLGKGPFLRETKLGSEISADRAFRVAAGSFIYSRVFAWRGAFGIVPPKFDGTFVSNEFPTYKIDESDVLIDFLGSTSCGPPCGTRSSASAAAPRRAVATASSRTA